MPFEVLQIMGDQLTRGIGCRAWTTTNTPLGLISAPLPPLEASPLCSKVALADSVDNPLEASALCSKVALADSAEDPLEASPLCSKVALPDLVETCPCRSLFEDGCLPCCRERAWHRHAQKKFPKWWSILEQAVSKCFCQERGHLWDAQVGIVRAARLQC